MRHKKNESKDKNNSYTLSLHKIVLNRAFSLKTAACCCLKQAWREPKTMS